MSHWWNLRRQNPICILSLHLVFPNDHTLVLSKRHCPDEDVTSVENPRLAKPSFFEPCVYYLFVSASFPLSMIAPISPSAFLFDTSLSNYSDHRRNLSGQILDKFGRNFTISFLDTIPWQWTVNIFCATGRLSVIHDTTQFTF
jgi:hypothetical protein